MPGSVFGKGVREMAWVLVRHKVEEYERWRRVFDGPGSALKGSGCKGGYVFHTEGDPNDIWVLTEFESSEAFRQFAAGHDVEKSKRDAGVIGEPEGFFLEELPKPDV